MTTMTRGPRPPAVYWRRRLVVLLVALLLVVGTARLVGAVGGESSAEEQAVQSSAESEVAEDAQEPSSLPTSDAGSTGGDGADTETEGDTEQAQPTGEGKAKAKRKGEESPTTPPAPVGTCIPSDVRVQPVVEEAVAGREVSIALELRTRDALACTWEVSPRALTMKITSGPDEIWTSRQCPRAVPTQEVVLRNEGSTTVEVPWSSRRSDDGCTRLTEWARAGYYHVTAAALAGEPSDVQFELTLPEAPVVTASPEPDEKNEKKSKNEKNEDEQAD